MTIAPDKCTMGTELPYPTQMRTESKKKMMIMGKRDSNVFSVERSINIARQNVPTPANSATQEAIINQVTAGARTLGNVNREKERGVKTEEEGGRNPQSATRGRDSPPPGVTLNRVSHKSPLRNSSRRPRSGSDFTPLRRSTATWERLHRVKVTTNANLFQEEDMFEDIKVDPPRTFSRSTKDKNKKL